MAIVLIGNGGIFTRLGQLFGMMKRVRLTQLELVTDTDGDGRCYVDFVTAMLPHPSFAAQVQWGAPLINNGDGAAESLGLIYSTLLRTAENLLIEQVNADAKLPDKNVKSALMELQRQMIATTKSFDGPDIGFGAASATSGNSGNGTITMGLQPSVVYGAGVSEFPSTRAETLTFRCVKDSQNSDVVTGGERFTIEGEEPFGHTSYKWPGGTGLVRKEFTCITSAREGKKAPNTNLLMNTQFKRFTGAVPNFFTVVSGASDISKETTVTRSGSAALQFTGDGSTVCHIRQLLGSTTGSPVSVLPDTTYLIAAAIRRDASDTPASGTLLFQIENSSGALLTTAGASPSLSVDVSSCSTSAWTMKYAVVRTPKVLPDPAYFAIKESSSASLPNTKIVYIDDVVMAPLEQIAPGGPFAAILAGDTPWKIDDSATVAVTNDGAGDYITEMDRAFGLYLNGIQFPMLYDGNETVLDNLIP